MATAKDRTESSGRHNDWAEDDLRSGLSRSCTRCICAGRTLVVVSNFAGGQHGCCSLGLFLACDRTGIRQRQRPVRGVPLDRQQRQSPLWRSTGFHRSEGGERSRCSQPQSGHGPQRHASHNGRRPDETRPERRRHHSGSSSENSGKRQTHIGTPAWRRRAKQRQLSGEGGSVSSQRGLLWRLRQNQQFFRHTKQRGL